VCFCWHKDIISLTAKTNRRNQQNFLGRTAALGCEGFSKFWEIIPPPSLGCAGDLVAAKLMTSFGATRPLAYPEDGDGISSRNFRKFSHFYVAVCQGKFNWILSPRELRDFKRRKVYTFMGGLKFWTFKNILFVYIKQLRRLKNKHLTKLRKLCRVHIKIKLACETISII